ncbi:MAG: GNAT family N-acetyltransferase [Eubacteriales bacterium]
MNIKIKPIKPDFADDFFDFFDNRAFYGHEEWSCCYCTWFHMDKEYEKRVGEEVKSDSSPDALRRSLKNTAAAFLINNTLHDYLAYMDGVPVGWCNANDKEIFLRFDFNADITYFIRQNGSGKIKTVVCFGIAPEYRRKGVAAVLLERVLADAHLTDNRCRGLSTFAI